MNPLTWQNPGQLFVAQDIIKVKIYSVAELRYIKNSALSNYLINFGEYTIQTLKTDTDKYVKIKITKVMPNTYTTILRAAKEDVRSHQNIIKLVRESKKLPDSLKSILIMHIENGLTILDEVYMVEMMFQTPVYIL